MWSFWKTHRRSQSAGTEQPAVNGIIHLDEPIITSSNYHSRSKSTSQDGNFNNNNTTSNNMSINRKKLNPINLLKKASGGSSHSNSDSSRHGVDEFADINRYRRYSSLSTDQCREAGVIYGTRTHEWGTATSSPTTTSSPSSSGNISLSPVMVNNHPRLSEESALSSVEEQLHGSEEEKNEDIMSEKDADSNTGLGISQPDDDNRSMFSFEEEQEIGRNLSVNYHKTPPQSGDAASSSPEGSSSIYNYDEIYDYYYDDEELLFDESLNMDDDDDQHEEEDCSHLFRDYHSYYDEPIAPLSPGNNDTNRNSNIPSLTPVTPLNVVKNSDRPYSPLVLKIPQTPPYDFDSMINIDDDDDDFYNNLLDEANEVPEDYDEYIDSGISFRSLSSNSSSSATKNTYNNKPALLGRSKSLSFDFPTTRNANNNNNNNSLYRRKTSIIRTHDNTITLFASSLATRASSSASTSASSTLSSSDDEYLTPPASLNTRKTSLTPITEHSGDIANTNQYF